MYIYIYIYIYIGREIWIYTYIHVYTYVRVYMCMCIYVYIYILCRKLAASHASVMYDMTCGIRYMVCMLTWCVLCDYMMWHAICRMWHVTCDVVYNMLYAVVYSIVSCHRVLRWRHPVVTDTYYTQRHTVRCRATQSCTLCHTKLHPVLVCYHLLLFDVLSPRATRDTLNYTLFLKRGCGESGQRPWTFHAKATIFDKTWRPRTWNTNLLLRESLLCYAHGMYSIPQCYAIYFQCTLAMLRNVFPVHAMLWNTMHAMHIQSMLDAINICYAMLRKFPILYAISICYHYVLFQMLLIDAMLFNMIRN